MTIPCTTEQMLDLAQRMEDPNWSAPFDMEYPSRCLAAHLDVNYSEFRQEPLFTPNREADFYLDTCHGITPVQAAQALRNYVAFGEPRWREITPSADVA